MTILVAVAAYVLGRFAAARAWKWLAAWTGRDTSPVRLDLATRAAAPVAPPDPLCYGCVYAHMIRGDAPMEELIACGYVFPMRETPFRVLECTDYRPKRERNRVEIANERAVCILPLEEQADVSAR